MNKQKVPRVIRHLSSILREYDTGQDDCVYILMYESEVLYVGRSKNLGMRLKEHLDNFYFDRAFYIPVKKGAANSVEVALIDALIPTRNLRKKTNGLHNKHYQDTDYVNLI